MTNKIEIYGNSISGNCYKLQLLCAQLGIDHVWHELDVLAGAARSNEYRAMNPNGKTPLLKLADGRFLPESNAILYYLAQGSPLVADDAYEMANILSWMCFEQYSHEPYIAVARFIMVYMGNPPEEAENLESKRRGGYKALKVMEGQLAEHDYFANDRYSIADIALYAYTHKAHEGGFDLAAYPAIQDWLARVADHPRHISMAEA